MNDCLLAERRRSQLQSMSLLVDLGVTYARTRGEPAARSFFENNDIPEEIVERALSSPDHRRRTHWERCPFEAAVRQVLSARPLLSAAG
jgi:hypothetical protein